MELCSGKIIKCDLHIEEKVLIKIGNDAIWCFISNSEVPIVEGVKYDFYIEYQIFNDYHVKLFDADKFNQVVHNPFLQISDTFQYELYGIFEGDRFKVGEITFLDPYLLSEFTVFEKQKICLSVDRLDLDIISISQSTDINTCSGLI